MGVFSKSVTLAAGLAAALIAASAQAEQLKVKLEWLPSGIHAWYHLAVEKGWYRDAGLDVFIEDGKGSGVAAQLLATGAFDIGGNISLGAMAIARTKDMNNKAIAAMAQKSDMGFIFPKGKGWKSPKDFVDAKAQIIITPGDVWSPFLEVIFKTGGSDVKNAQLLNIAPAAKNSTYISTDNMVMTTVPPFTIPLVEKDRPSDLLMVYDIGLTLPGWGLIASDAALQKRPAEVKKFVQATMRAFDYVTKGNEGEGVDAVMKARPDAKLNRDLAIAQLKLYRPLFQDDSLKGKPSGFMSPENWTKSLKTMADVGLVPADVKAAEFFSNDYLQ